MVFEAIQQIVQKWTALRIYIPIRLSHIYIYTPSRSRVGRIRNAVFLDRMVDVMWAEWQNPGPRAPWLISEKITSQWLRQTMHCIFALYLSIYKDHSLEVCALYVLPMQKPKTRLDRGGARITWRCKKGGCLRRRRRAAYRGGRSL